MTPVAQAQPTSVLAMRAGPRGRERVLFRSRSAVIGAAVLATMFIACICSLPWTLSLSDRQDRLARHLPPAFVPLHMAPAANPSLETAGTRLWNAARRDAQARFGTADPSAEQIAASRPSYLLGTDLLGRSVLIRCAAGGGISLSIGICAATISVLLGTLYGSLAGYIGGRLDALMMRIVDVLYGLPYILLVVLLAVAVSAVIDDAQSARARRATQARADWVRDQIAALPDPERAAPSLELKNRLNEESLDRFPSELSRAGVQTLQIVTLFVAIGGVSWLTMARVVRGQVLSLKGQPFVEAARAIGVSHAGIFRRHLLPNLVGPIAVYATLTVPQAILQESFLSFLGIGVAPPIPSWGNLAADGLNELNPVRSNWWLITFPCVLLGTTLLALNFMGEGLREALDPKRRSR